MPPVLTVETLFAFPVQWTKMHKLSNIDTDKRTAECEECGSVLIRYRQKNKNTGKITWRCANVVNRRQNARYWPYRLFKGHSCERCGFIPEHRSQLDVDHIDGNSKNHERSNLQTLCANCHRLKTIENGDHMKSKKDPHPFQDEGPLVPRS